MQISKSMTLVENQSGITTRRLVGWGIVVTLCFLELLAALYAAPSVLIRTPWVLGLVEKIGEWVPLVQSFSRCAAKLDSGSGLMLALNVIFFPIKLGAIYYAHPKKLQNPDKGWKAAFGTFYVFLIALVALVPILLFYVGWGNVAESTGLSSIDRKMVALCRGGTAGFIASVIQGGFAMLGAYVSLIIFLGIGRSFKAAVSTN